MEDNYFTISQHKLSNHCPECYSADGLEITFKQRFNETSFYRAITGETKHKLHCNTCNTEIYPVRWTEDIDRVVEYHTRALKPKRPTTKLKQLTWILIIVSLVLTAVMVFSYFKDTNVIA